MGYLVPGLACFREPSKVSLTGHMGRRELKGKPKQSTAGLAGRTQGRSNLLLATPSWDFHFDVRGTKGRTEGDSSLLPEWQVRSNRPSSNEQGGLGPDRELALDERGDLAED